MLETITLSAIVGSGITLTLCRLLPLRTLVKYAIYFDVFFTLVLPFLLSRSTDGMIIAILAGIVVTIQLALIQFFTHIFNSLTN